MKKYAIIALTLVLVLVLGCERELGSEVDTSDWSVYNNYNYLASKESDEAANFSYFSIKYPSEWSVKEIDRDKEEKMSRVAFDGDVVIVAINLYGSDSDMTLDNCLEEDDNLDFINEETVSINGNKAYKYDYVHPSKAKMSRVFCMNFNNNIVEITGMVDNDRYLSTVDAMVSLLRLGDLQEDVDAESGVENSGWLTYENEEYGFSFDYPSDWNLEESFEMVYLKNYIVDNEETKGYLADGESKVDILFDVDDKSYNNLFSDVHELSGPMTDYALVSSNQIEINGKLFNNIIKTSNVDSSYTRSVGIATNKGNLVFTVIISVDDNMESNIDLIDLIYSTIEINS